MTPASSPPPHEAFGKALPWILFITLMFLSNQVSRMILSPMLVPLEHDFAFSHATAGSLLLLTSTGNATSLLLSGFLSGRLQHRRIIPLSVGCYGLSLITLSHAATLTDLRIGFALCGLSGGLYFPSGMAAIGSIVHRRHWGKTIAVHELGPNLAFILAPLLAEVALQYTDWRHALQYMGGSALCCAALFLVAGRGGSFCGEPPGRHTISPLLRRSDTWMFLLLMIVAVAIEWAPYSIMSLYLVTEHHMPRAEANTLIGLSRMTTPLLVLVGGWLTDRMQEEPIILWTFVGSVVCIAALGIAEGPLLTVFLFAQPMLPPLMFPAIFKIFAHAFVPQERSLVLSLTMPPVIMLGAGAIPAMIGLCGDLGSFGTGFKALAVMGIACIPVILRFCRHTSRLDS